MAKPLMTPDEFEATLHAALDCPDRTTALQLLATAAEAYRAAHDRALAIESRWPTPAEEQKRRDAENPCRWYAQYGPYECEKCGAEYIHCDGVDLNNSDCPHGHRICPKDPAHA